MAGVWRSRAILLGGRLALEGLDESVPYEAADGPVLGLGDGPELCGELLRNIDSERHLSGERRLLIHKQNHRPRAYPYAIRIIGLALPLGAHAGGRLATGARSGVQESVRLTGHCRLSSAASASSSPRSRRRAWSRMNASMIPMARSLPVTITSRSGGLRLRFFRRGG